MKKILMLAVICQFFLTSACTTWQPAGVSWVRGPVQDMGEYIELEKPSKMRATVLGGEQFELTQPTLEGDALVSSDGVSVRLDEIISLEVGRIALVRSALAGFGIGMGGLIALQYVTCGDQWAC